jgi:hypothetical protein
MGNMIVTALAALAALASALFVLFYMLLGSSKKSFFGRGLLSLQGGIFTVLAYTVQRRLTLGVHLPTSQLPAAFFAFGLITLVELIFTAGLIQLLVIRRGGLAAAWRTRKSRVAAVISDSMIDHLTTLSVSIDLLDDDEFWELAQMVRRRQRPEHANPV